MRNNKWKKFEKVAAAIRSIGQNGTSVKWNSRITGQRFDAVLRSWYENEEYLIAVDCVDDNVPVTAARVKSFAKKVEAAGAHMGIMVSSSEFLQDAFELTAKHSVAVLDGKAMNEMSEQQLADTFKPALSVHGFRYVLNGGSGEMLIPEEPALLKFLMREVQIKGPGIDTVPERLVKETHGELIRSAIGKPQRYEVALPKGTVVIHPNSGGKTPVDAFAFTYHLIPISALVTTEGLDDDPYLIESSLKEELAKRNPSADPSKMESGFDTILRPGKYYYNPRLQFSYYCEAVKKGKAKIVLVESYQNDGLLQARGIISRPLYSQFVEITEEGEIDRLTKLYDKFSVSNKNLEGRYKVFLRDLEGAECIDELALTPKQRKANKADYFFENRRIVGELKALYTDTTPKIEAILAPYRETPEWPLFFGEQDLQLIISHLPNSGQVSKRIFEAVTDSIEAVVEKANRQIRATKETFELPDAGGLLIILNDAVDVLAPNLVASRVRKSLNKRTSKGELRFPHVSAVLLIGGAHYTQMTPTLKGIPLLIIPNVVPEADRVEEFVQTLNEKWSAFDKQPLFQVETEMVPKLDFRKFSEDAKKSARPLTNQEFWSSEYQRNPYLRSLGEEQLLEFGRKVFEDVSARLIKGAPKTPKDQMIPIWIRWNNFLGEMKYRALDMRKFTAKLEGLGSKMEELYQHYQEQNQS